MNNPTITPQDLIPTNIGKIGLSALALLLILSFITFDIVKINDRQVGVITQFGKAVNSVNGWSVKIPFIQNHAVTYDTSVQSLSVDANTATADQQSLKIKINVQYRLDGSKAIEIYKLVKDQEFLNGNIIPPFIQEATKASTTKFTASELLVNRDKVKLEIEQALSTRMKEYYSTVVAVNIENIDWSDAYDKAIESKVITQQETETAKQRLEKAKAESEVKITEARAEAEANTLKKESITPELIQFEQLAIEKRKIEKWNGQLPNATGVNGIFNLK
jgi:regulator of protease activity HflC (stomatin/prohibitin superfamily)